jgi:hypothetical protein
MKAGRKPLNPLRFSDRIVCLPVVHGSGACALAVRQWLLEHPCDCLAVGLPQSFRYEVLEGIQALPYPALVLQRPLSSLPSSTASPSAGQDAESVEPAWNYVPIDPCQPVIMALRVACGERWDIAFCDMETNHFQPFSAAMPDPYALKTVSLERFATAVLPSIARPVDQQVSLRLRYQASRLRSLENHYQNVVYVCSVVEWPWLREAYREPSTDAMELEETVIPERYRIQSQTLMFMLGELPFTTGMYESARASLTDDTNLGIDSVKHLLLSARSSYLQDFGKRARRITPLMLSQCLKYIRNLTLLENRMSPDLYTIGLASQQILGDQFAIHVIETARHYPFDQTGDPTEESALQDDRWPAGDMGPELPIVSMGIDQLRLPDGNLIDVVSRLPGQPVQWRTLELRRKPNKQDVRKWQMQWNPYSQCSWPPEDQLIESFRTRVADRAKALIGADLARSEKFSTSIMDGIDIRETLRHWYDRDIYVKIMPPNIGTLDCVVMIFDTPADPRDYPWKTTWFAEHQNESTLAFFASDFAQEMVGPGIAMATYGGALFLFPPVAIPDIWHDPRLNIAQDLEERLLAAACLHSRESRIALLSPKPPGTRWRRIARHYRKQWVHVPLSQFNDGLVQQLRMVHVLNGKQVRSYAQHFIRKA